MIDYYINEMKIYKINVGKLKIYLVYVNGAKRTLES